MSTAPVRTRECVPLKILENSPVTVQGTGLENCVQVRQTLLIRLVLIVLISSHFIPFL